MKLKYYKLLSNFAYNCNVRHYILDARHGHERELAAAASAAAASATAAHDTLFADLEEVRLRADAADDALFTAAGRCRLTLL